MTCQKCSNLLHYYVEKQVFSWRTKNSYIWCIYTWKSRFFYDATENKVYIWCIITFRSRFSHDATKTLIFDAVLSRKAGFLMTRQKWCKRVALLRDKAGLLRTHLNSYIWCINTWKSRFSHDANENKVYIWCIITFRSRFTHDAPKSLLVNALLRGKAGFLMTRQKGANLLHYYVEKQAFSWRAKKGANLLHYYVEKQVFSWRAKTLISDALIRGKTGFLMTQLKTSCAFDALLHFVAGFLMTRQKLLNLMHYYVKKQVFSWHAKKL